MSDRISELEKENEMLRDLLLEASVDLHAHALSDLNNYPYSKYEYERDMQLVNKIVQALQR